VKRDESRPVKANWPYQSNGVTTASRWSMLSQSGVGWRDAAHVSWRLQRHAVPTASRAGSVCWDASRHGVGISHCTTLVYRGRGANPYSYLPSKWARVLRVRALNRSFS